MRAQRLMAAHPSVDRQLVVSTGRRNTQVEPDFMKAALEPFSAATLPEQR
jgi:hypothetical protein